MFNKEEEEKEVREFFLLKRIEKLIQKRAREIYLWSGGVVWWKHFYARQAAHACYNPMTRRILSYEIFYDHHEQKP